jgi:hypothetical protein
MPGYLRRMPIATIFTAKLRIGCKHLGAGEDVTALTQSYFHRASATPLLNDTLGGALDKAAEHWPDQEAVVVRDQDPA